MKHRVIYMIEHITDDGNLQFRLFAANKKTALKIVKAHGGSETDIRKLQKDDMRCVNPNDVERW